MRKIAVIVLLSLSVAACAQFQAGLTKVNIFANKYGPIIGNDVLMISNILVRAECSHGLASGSAVAGNILNIIAPNSTSVSKVVGALNTNVAVANQLCPALAAVKGSIGSVPNVAPSQVVTP